MPFSGAGRPIASAGGADRQDAPPKVRVALDSLLEGDRFEPSGPRKFFWTPRRSREFTFRNINRHPSRQGPGRTVVRVSPGGEHLGTPAQQLLQGTRFRALALPTAARDSAVHFTLLAASGMIGNQRLEHSGEPQGKSFGSDTLGGNAGALAQQEDFVGETLGIGELGIAAQANKPFADRGFILADDTPRRMIRVRQLDRSVGECTAALGLVLLEVTDMAQPRKELAFRIARVGIAGTASGGYCFGIPSKWRCRRIIRSRPGRRSTSNNCRQGNLCSPPRGIGLAG